MPLIKTLRNKKTGELKFLRTKRKTTPRNRRSLASRIEKLPSKGLNKTTLS